MSVLSAPRPSVPTFSRSMHMIGALLITLSSITPASSIFIIVPSVVEQAGTGALWSFAIAAFISLLSACSYAELSSAFPVAGGEYAIVARTLGPLPGFIILGVNLVALLLNIAVVALGLGQFVATVFPGHSPVVDGLGCVLLTTLCAILNVRTNALITGAFLVLEMVALVVVTALGFVFSSRSWVGLVAHPVHVAANGQLAPVSLGLIGLASSVAIFAFYGYGTAVYLGEETRDAPRHIARAVLWALAISVLSQILPLAALLHGARDLARTLVSDSMFSDFVRGRGGPALGVAINLSVALAIINANIAVMVLLSRMLFSSGRDQVWSTSLNRFLTRLHPRYGSPWAATLVTGVLAALLCFVGLHFLTIMTGTAIILVYVSICAAVIAGRRNGTTRHAAYRLPFYPWTPLLALLGLACILFFLLQDPVLGRPGFFATLAVAAVSVAYYLFVLRRRGDWILHDPTCEALPLVAPEPPSR